MAGFGGFAGLSGVAEGYQQGVGADLENQIRRQRLLEAQQTEQRAQAAKALFGQSLGLIAPGATPMPGMAPPGLTMAQTAPAPGPPPADYSNVIPGATPIQPQPGFQPGPVGPYANAGQLGPGGAPSDPTGVMRPPVPGMPPRAAPPSLPQRTMMPPPMGGPPQGFDATRGLPGAPGGAPSGGGVQGPLDWRQAVQAIKRANPDADPATVADAMSLYFPIMREDSLQQWRLIQAQFKEYAADQATKRAEIGAGSRENIAGQQLAAKIQIAREALRGKTDVQSQKDAAALDRTLAIIEGRHEDVATQQAGAGARVAAQQEGAGARVAAQQEGAGARQDKAITAAGERQERGITAAGARQDKALEAAQKRTETRVQAQARKAGFEPATMFRARGDIQRYNHMLAQLDRAFDDIQAGISEGHRVTGVLGKINRAGEFVVNATMFSDATRANEFAQRINELIVMLPRALTGKAQTGKDERARVEGLVKGLSFGSTTAITVKSLQQIQQTLQELKPVLEPHTGTYSWQGQGAQAPAAGAPQAPAAQAPQAPQGEPVPQIGDVKYGHVFQGGDPNDPNSWVKQ